MYSDGGAKGGKNRCSKIKGKEWVAIFVKFLNSELIWFSSIHCRSLLVLCMGSKILQALSQSGLLVFTATEYIIKLNHRQLTTPHQSTRRGYYPFSMLKLNVGRKDCGLLIVTFITRSTHVIYSIVQFNSHLLQVLQRISAHPWPKIQLLAL